MITNKDIETVVSWMHLRSAVDHLAKADPETCGKEALNSLYKQAYDLSNDLAWKVNELRKKELGC